MFLKNNTRSICKLSLSIIFSFTISTSVCYAQNLNTLKTKIDSIIQVKSPRPFNGVILITKNDKKIYSKAYGFKNFETKAPLKIDNQFEIKSNTKQVTAVLILKEVEKGRVNLQASIKTYLPSITQPWADSVTVHQLLNHTHGIISMDKPLAFKPGSDFKYGNLSNILLGEILENINQKPYKEIADSLFRTLKMKNTFCFSNDNKRNLVSGHMNTNNVFSVVKNSFINDDNLAADGIITSAKDLAIWNSNLHKGKILKPETYALMITPTVLSKHDVFSEEKMGYGYGIRLIKDKKLNYLGHTGLGDGFASLNIYIPTTDVSLIILENQMTENPDLYYYFEKNIKDLLISNSQDISN